MTQLSLKPPFNLDDNNLRLHFRVTLLGSATLNMIMLLLLKPSLSLYCGGLVLAVRVMVLSWAKLSIVQLLLKPPLGLSDNNLGLLIRATIISSAKLNIMQQQLKPPLSLGQLSQSLLLLTLH
jgi:hypothetical protein